MPSFSSRPDVLCLCLSSQNVGPCLWCCHAGCECARPKDVPCGRETVISLV